MTEYRDEASGQRAATTDDGRVPDCTPKTPEDRLADLISTMASATKITTKVQRWGLDSHEPRPSYPNYLKSNRVILAGLIADLRRDLSGVEADLSTGVTSTVSVEQAKQLTEALERMREKAGLQAVLDLLKQHGCTTAAELLSRPASVISEVTQKANRAGGCVMLHIGGEIGPGGVERRGYRMAYPSLGGEAVTARAPLPEKWRGPWTREKIEVLSLELRDSLGTTLAAQLNSRFAVNLRQLLARPDLWTIYTEAAIKAIRDHEVSLREVAAAQSEEGDL